MSKKKSKAKKTKAKALKANQQRVRKAQTVSRVLTITILGVLGFFVYSDVKAESLQGTQNIYDDSEYLDYLHELDAIKESLGIYELEYDLDRDPEYQDMPKQITVCWSASQQRLVPAYMAETECGS